MALDVEDDLVGSYELLLETVYNDLLKCYSDRPISEGLHHLNDEQSNRLDKAIESVEMVPDRHTFEDRLCLH